VIIVALAVIAFIVLVNVDFKHLSIWVFDDGSAILKVWGAFKFLCWIAFGLGLAYCFHRTMRFVPSQEKEPESIIILRVGDTILAIKDGEPNISLIVTHMKNNVIKVEKATNTTGKYLLVFNDNETNE